MLLAQAHAALQEAQFAVARGNQSYQAILDIIASLESELGCRSLLRSFVYFVS